MKKAPLKEPDAGLESRSLKGEPIAVAAGVLGGSAGEGGLADQAFSRRP
jgi:hypothetical protein